MAKVICDQCYRPVYPDEEAKVGKTPYSTAHLRCATQSLFGIDVHRTEESTFETYGMSNADFKDFVNPDEGDR